MDGAHCGHGCAAGRSPRLPLDPLGLWKRRRHVESLLAQLPQGEGANQAQVSLEPQASRHAVVLSEMMTKDGARRRQGVVGEPQREAHAAGEAKARSSDEHRDGRFLPSLTPLSLAVRGTIWHG